jgi:hypothetical protein
MACGTWRTDDRRPASSSRGGGRSARISTITRDAIGQRISRTPTMINLAPGDAPACTAEPLDMAPMRTASKLTRIQERLLELSP